ncbi:uncharacterized protein LOC133928357 isoform X2 [Phragmites australis]|uniref:uncharacterized protein LOC133928357 isoform X2 n=1 Tax=Phragmites australis TaxID=29695 RepID=UPI002D787A7A|nr:uncharacterized protein LOC133928357 isoform X2 [Phragmites australis]
MEYKARSNGASGASTGNLGDRYNYVKYSSSLNDEPMPDAASEKEQGNEYFKQKKFSEAIECYSRSIGLSPTAVAFANRAMAYLKLRRFEKAEDDCTEALNLDDRYIKAYSRRITARKELGKLKEAMDDAEFAISLDPNNAELRKQYSEIKALHMEKMAKKASVLADKKDSTSHPPTISQKDSFMEVDSPIGTAMEMRESAGGRPKGGSGVIINNSVMQSRDAKQKPGSEASVQDLASRAASRYLASTVKSIKTPKTAYDFEVSWRALSDDTAQQIHLLKSIPPASLPEIFKNSLSAAFLIEIVKCASSIFRYDAALAVSILENLAKVPRFDLIIMCLSSMHKSELRRMWDEVFLVEKASADQMEVLRQLRGKYIQGGWQDSMFASS